VDNALSPVVAEDLRKLDMTPSTFVTTGYKTQRMLSFLVEPRAKNESSSPSPPKMAVAHEGKTVKDFLIELAEAKIQELERQGIFPKGK
jgi:hypothetical protein